MIGVIDVRGGVAVHARGGVRDRYGVIGDAVGLAREYVEIGVTELYVADLDSIAQPENATLTENVRAICGLADVWLDAGVSSPARAQEVVAAGAARVVVGLETLSSFDALAHICDDIGGHRVSFSLDLMNGRPLGIGANVTPAALAARAAEARAGSIVVLDLARVGTATGLDFSLLERVRLSAPDVEMFAGGGVRNSDDLAQLAELGFDGALVATALRELNLTGGGYVPMR